MLNIISLQQVFECRKKLIPFDLHFSTHLVRNNFGENCFSDFCGKIGLEIFLREKSKNFLNIVRSKGKILFIVDRVSWTVKIVYIYSFLLSNKTL